MRYYHLKQGVNINMLSPILESKLWRISLTIKLIIGDPNYTFTITSANDGNHMKGSKHYTNEAIDIRIRDIHNSHHALVVAGLKKMLGRHFDVVYETTHIHIEYDPK